jgi:hypothetical protein
MSNFKLYEINELLEMAISEAVDTETGEIREGYESILDEIQTEKEEKIKSVALYIKNIESFQDQIKAEQERLSLMVERSKKESDFLKSYLLRYVDKTEKYLECTIKVNTSTSTEIVDETKIPACCVTTKTVSSISKTAVKELILAGTIPESVAFLKTNKSITIK